MALTEKDQTLLEIEASKGAQHASAWTNLVEPFFDKKSAELYDAFVNCPVRDKEALVEIHAQHLGLKSMKAHFITFIETGKMAQITLNENEEKGKDDGD